MNKYEYRCNKCLVIEERWLLYFKKPTDSIPCPKCGRSAIRLPYSNLTDKVFDRVKKAK